MASEPGMTASTIARARNQVEREVHAMLNMLCDQTGLEIDSVSCHSVKDAGRSKLVAVEIGLRMPRVI